MDEDEKPKDQKPVDQGRGDRVDVDQVVDRTVRRVYQESIATKYVECPGCGNLILRKYGECHKCKLRFNPVDQSWVATDIPAEDREAGDDRSTLII